MTEVREDFLAVQPLDAPVVVVGSANVDLTVRVQDMPQPGQTVRGGPLAILPGGKSANQAVAAALLGAPTWFVGAVGQDDNGTFLLESLRRSGVDTQFVSRTQTATSCAVITVDSRAENMIVVTSGANDDVSSRLVEESKGAIERARALGLALEIPMDAVVAAARTAHAAGVPVVLNPSPMPDSIPPELLETVSVLIVNEGEMEAIVGGVGEDWGAASKAFAALGVDRAIVTLGPRGAIVLDGGATLVPTVDVPAVDTTGCGDSFTGAVLAALAAGSDLVTASKFASIIASYAAGGAGAQASYGTLEQVEQKLLD